MGEVRRRIERAVADGTPQQLKRLLGSVVDQIVVESRASIQPYFVAPYGSRAYPFAEADR